MSGNWYSICKVHEIPRSGGRTIKAGERSVALFRLSNDSIRAIENRCPHKGGPLADGVISGGDILCPLHNWRVDLETGDVAAPESGCVTVFPVRVEDDGQILLLL
ncbi:MAG: nitrite reductase (NAD(P)H) small subunit [Zetaproteobacteria bacterium CG_4_9_14_3_um_filter_53_7]|nr:MAG: nitrite reductase (NAD(P)H) small subunit [Zetaproteobacteria bacterium CG_4_9_14_3_um_filter_53_7]